MKIRVLMCVAGLIAGLAFVASAADVSGKWKAEFQTPDGQTRTTTFAFKVDGEKLTGSVGGPRGESEISDGKVSGDEISFSVIRKFNDQEFKMQYKGKVAGDEIKFTVSFPEGDRTFDMTAKRVQ